MIKQGLVSNIVLQKIWVIGHTVNLFWACTLQKLIETFKSTTKNKHNKCAYFLQMFWNYTFKKKLSKYMTMILTVCD